MLMVAFHFWVDPFFGKKIEACGGAIDDWLDFKGVVGRREYISRFQILEADLARDLEMANDLSVFHENEQIEFRHVDVCLLCLTPIVA